MKQKHGLGHACKSCCYTRQYGILDCTHLLWVYKVEWVGDGDVSTFSWDM